MMVNFGQKTWSTGNGWSTDSKLMQISQGVNALLEDATQSTFDQQQLVNIDCQHTLSTLIVNKYHKRMIYEKLTTFVNRVKDVCGVKGVERVALGSANRDASDSNDNINNNNDNDNNDAYIVFVIFSPWTKFWVQFFST